MTNTTISDLLNSLNKQQEEVVYSTSRRLLCLSGAGTGKTHTIICKMLYHTEILKLDPKKILAVTFTNAAGKEMESRFKRYSTSIDIPIFGTFHNFCYKVLSEQFDVRQKLGYDSIPEIISEFEESTLQTKAKMLTNVKLPKYAYKLTYTPKKHEEFEYKVFQKTMDKLLRQYNQITFDRLCYRICELFSQRDPSIQKYLDQFSYVYVDEFQDTDPLQWKFVQAFMKSSSIVLVGDARQCQPSGTRIVLSNLDEKNIEDIKVGDYVLTYNASEGRYITQLNFNSGNKNRYSKKVVSISKHFAKDVVKIVSKTHSSRYTKDHITYARVHYEGNESHYVTYLMHNAKGWWRVGSTKLFLESQKSMFGPRLRLQSECGDKIWILDVYKTVSEAWMNEQIVAYKYGIPQITWEHQNVKFSNLDIVNLYNHLGSLDAKAEQCLKDYGRDARYPFFSSDWKHIHFSKKHMFECRVGNLIPGIFDIVYPDYVEDNQGNKILRNSYEVIQYIEAEPDQYVYGLEVEDNHNYVGDGILTHNCIYQFRGSDSSIIKQISTDDNWDTIKLEKNYRSTKRICEYANNFSKNYDDDLPEVHLITDNPQGQAVKSISSYEFEYNISNYVSVNNTSCAILARTNAEVKYLTELLDSNSVSYRTKSHMKFSRLVACALDEDYRRSMFLNLLTEEEKSNLFRKMYLNPSYDPSSYLNSKFSDILEAIDEIQQLDEYPQIKLQYDLGDISIYDLVDTSELSVSELYVGTIHSVKGLEFDKVIVYGVNSKSFKVLSSEELMNLYYVACTRPKSELILVEDR